MQPEAVAQWIEESFDAWAERIVQPSSCVVAPDSSLASNQVRDLPGERSVVQMAWRSMANAGEHLVAARHVTATGTVLAKPFLTLARTTMVGAARALYLLEPDRPVERSIRALRLLRTESKDADRLVKVWKSEAGKENAELQAVSDDLRAESEAALVQMGEKPGSEMSDAALLARAAAHLSNRPGNPLARLIELWNISSGNAHNRTWTWDMGFGSSDFLEQFVRIWILPTDLMEHAWDRWNERRTAPQR